MYRTQWTMRPTNGGGRILTTIATTKRSECSWVEWVNYLKISYEKNVNIGFALWATIRRIFMFPPPTRGGERHGVFGYASHPSAVRASVRGPTYFGWGGTSILSRYISIILTANNHHVSGSLCKGFQCQSTSSKCASCLLVIQQVQSIHQFKKNAQWCS